MESGLPDDIGDGHGLAEGGAHDPCSRRLASHASMSSAKNAVRPGEIWTGRASFPDLDSRQIVVRLSPVNCSTVRIDSSRGRCSLGVSSNCVLFMVNSIAQRKKHFLQVLEMLKMLSMWMESVLNRSGGH